MDCPHCRTAVPEGASFCSSCGKPVPAAPAGEGRRPDSAAGARPSPTGAAHPLTGRPAETPPAEGSGTERWLDYSSPSEWSERRAGSSGESDSRSRMGLLIAALLVLLLLVGGGAFWLLGRPRGAPASVTTVRPTPVPPGPAVTQAPASPPPPAAAPQPQGMPEEIRRYLAFLQGVEAQRKQYEAQLSQQMLAVVPNLMAPDFSENSQPPDQQLVRQYDQMAQQYSQATIRFQTEAQRVNVPLACRKLHGHYSTALSLNPRLILETARRLGAGDYAGLLAMRGSIGKTIADNYQAADAELGRICDQYGVRKQFDIGSSGGGNSILMP
jgi:hypothetical protein